MFASLTAKAGPGADQGPPATPSSRVRSGHVVAGAQGDVARVALAQNVSIPARVNGVSDHSPHLARAVNADILPSTAETSKVDVNDRVSTDRASYLQVFFADGQRLPLCDSSVDLVVTSPPYWKKRDYGVNGQIGQEPTPQAYVESLLNCLREWRRVLRRTGSVFLNIGDTFYRRSLAGVPGRLEAAANDDGWLIRNRIVWTKDRGMPEPVQNRLAGRHEYVIHLVQAEDYYYDLLGYSQEIGNGSNPGDVWHISPERNMGRHLAPFPGELVRRAVLLGCPHNVCPRCGEPYRRIVKRTSKLDPSRPQARRAMQLAKDGGLTDAHIAAIQATGVSDAGKARRTQTGTGRNSAEVQRLAAEAKLVLGGYFREFTFALKQTVGWSTCSHGEPPLAGVVLDPFMGTGTTLKTATMMGRSAIGVDLMPHWS